MSHQKKKLESRVSMLSIIMVLLIFIIKAVTSFYTNSISFFAEFTDSGLDILVVTITIIALRKARKPADADHMFGHYKVNSFAGLVESILTVGLYVFIIYHSIITLIDFDDYEVNNPLIIIVSLIIIIVINLTISTVIIRTGNKLKNATIKAQGVNFRGDLYRNFAVIVGMILANFEYYIIDPILAIIFAFISIYQSYKVIQQSYGELMDYNAVDLDKIKKVRNDVYNIEQIKEIDTMAIKTVGNTLDTNLKIIVADNLSAFEIQSIMLRVKEEISKIFPDYLINVLVEIAYSPEDDQTYKYDEILNVVRTCARKLKFEPSIHESSIDILEDKIIIQFHINLDPNMILADAHKEITQLENFILHEMKKITQGREVQVYTHFEPTQNYFKFHDHGGIINIDDVKLSKFEKIIADFVDEHDTIKKSEIINLLDEVDGVHLSIKLFMNKLISIKESHLLTELLEVKLMESDLTIIRCTIHTEPI